MPLLLRGERGCEGRGVARPRWAFVASCHPHAVGLEKWLRIKMCLRQVMSISSEERACENSGRPCSLLFFPLFFQERHLSASQKWYVNYRCLDWTYSLSTRLIYWVVRGLTCLTCGAPPSAARGQGGMLSCPIKGPKWIRSVSGIRIWIRS